MRTQGHGGGGGVGSSLSIWDGLKEDHEHEIGPLRYWIPNYIQPSWPLRHTAVYRQSPPAPSTLPANHV